jgi:hypothetical protein
LPHPPRRVNSSPKPRPPGGDSSQARDVRSDGYAPSVVRGWTRARFDPRVIGAQARRNQPWAGFARVAMRSWLRRPLGRQRSLGRTG